MIERMECAGECAKQNDGQISPVLTRWPLLQTISRIRTSFFSSAAQKFAFVSGVSSWCSPACKVARINHWFHKCVCTTQNQFWPPPESDCTLSPVPCDPVYTITLSLILPNPISISLGAISHTNCLLTTSPYNQFFCSPSELHFIRSV